MIDEALKNRIETALNSDKLMDLFEQLEKEGLGKTELEDIFTDFLKTLPQEAKREANEEKLIDLLDGITGYCHPDRCLFPPEEYKAHPGIILFFAANEDRKLIVRFIIENTNLRLFIADSYESGELEIKSVEEIDFTKHLRFYLWNEIVSNEFTIHEQWFEHIQKTNWSFISNPTFLLNFGEIEDKVITISGISYAFHDYPTQAFFEAIEPIRSYVDKLKVNTAIGVPVLKDAYSLVEKGFSLKESAETRWNYELDSISV